MGQCINLDHLASKESNFKKIGWTWPEKPKLEKGWFGSKQNKGLLNLFDFLKDIWAIC